MVVGMSTERGRGRGRGQLVHWTGQLSGRAGGRRYLIMVLIYHIYRTIPRTKGGNVWLKHASSPALQLFSVK